ncbi:hypothetical protein ALC62_03596, partial [Cyphomyrmex costatus]
CIAVYLKFPYISSITFAGTIPGTPFPVYSRLENSKSSNKVTHSVSAVKRDRVTAFNFTTIVDERPFNCPPTTTCIVRARVECYHFLSTKTYSGTIAETIKLN